MKTVPFREIGPSFKMAMRRDKMASNELFKEACRKPLVRNPDKKKADKNKFTNVLGEKKGKVFVQQQDIDTLALRRYPGMGKKPSNATPQDKPAKHTFSYKRNKYENCAKEAAHSKAAPWSSSTTELQEAAIEIQQDKRALRKTEISFERESWSKCSGRKKNPEVVSNS